ncbi:MAG: hypothetical protein E7553_02745 [Ruminococcaceae bacterium]|nr:hypothetical protein [Oscillospiraceae bacterium]
MFSFFRRRQKPTDNSGGDPLLRKMDGKELAYVTERIRDDSGTVTERVLGKIGRLNARPDIITVVCDGTPVFSCDTAGAEYGELMSLAGVIIKGTDRDSGEYRTVVAYYQYWNKR